MAKKFLDLTGLGYFLDTIKSAYAANDTATYSSFSVGQADKLTNARTISLGGLLLMLSFLVSLR